MMNAPERIHPLEPPRLIFKYATDWKDATSTERAIRLTFHLVRHFYKCPEAKALRDLVYEISEGQKRRNGETYFHHYRRVASGSVFYSLMTQNIDFNTLYLRYLIGLGHDGIEDARKFQPHLESKFDDLARAFPLLRLVTQKIMAVSRITDPAQPEQFYLEEYYPIIIRDCDLRPVKQVDHQQNTDDQTTRKSMGRYAIGQAITTAIDLGMFQPSRSVQDFLMELGSYLLGPEVKESIGEDFSNPRPMLEIIESNTIITKAPDQERLSQEVAKRMDDITSFFRTCNDIEQFNALQRQVTSAPRLPEKFIPT